MKRTPKMPKIPKRPGFILRFLLTPEIAAFFLSLSEPIQRERRPGVVKKYVEDILAGKWRSDGAPLLFNTDRIMFDGQHRCKAVIDSGKSIWVSIRHGVSNETMMVTDSGVGRSHSDAIMVSCRKGSKMYDHAKVVAVALRYVISWERNEDNYYGSNVSQREVAEAASRHKGITESAEFFHDYGKNANIVNIKICVALHYLLCRENPQHKEKIDKFFEDFWEGTNLVKGSPIHVLIRTIGNTRAKKETQRPAYLMPLILRAWEYFYEGRKNVPFIAFKNELPKIKM